MTSGSGSAGSSRGCPRSRAAGFTPSRWARRRRPRRSSGASEGAGPPWASSSPPSRRRAPASWRESWARVATHRYFPIDLPGPVRRALGAVRPRFFVGMETELWPNFLRALASRGVPSMIANGRISDRSFKRYRLVRPLVARMLARVTVFAMQSEEDARRIIALGAPAERVVVTGNLKTDLVPGAVEHGLGGAPRPRAGRSPVDRGQHPPRRGSRGARRLRAPPPAASPRSGSSSLRATRSAPRRSSG